MRNFTLGSNQWIDAALSDQLLNSDSSALPGPGPDWELVRRALTLDRLVLFGQRIMPLGDESSGRSRVEILFRLITDDNQLVPLDPYLAEAAESGQACILDRYLMERAFSTLAQQVPKAGFRLDPVNISVSAVTVSEPDFLDYAVQALMHYRLPPASVCFDIRETAAITDWDAAGNFVFRMQSMGAMIALDDFGYSSASLANFRYLPINYLTIPGSFVRNLAHDPVDQMLVEAICGMAKRLGIETVAEGVDAQETLEFLRSVGCDHARGFFVHAAEPWPMLRELPQNAVLQVQAAYRTH